MLFKRSIRGAVSLYILIFSITQVLYLKSAVANPQIYYVCDDQVVSGCPTPKFKNLEKAVLAAGQTPTRIVVITDTRGTTIKNNQKILGIYGNRTKIISTLKFEDGSQTNNTEIFGIKFVPYSDTFNTIEVNRGAALKIIDNCFIGGNYAILGSSADLELENNYFNKNEHSLKLKGSSLESNEDTFSAIKDEILRISNSSNAIFSGANIVVSSIPTTAIYIDSSSVSFVGLNFSSVNADTNFHLGSSSELNIIGSQLYDLGGSNGSSNMFELDGSAQQLDIDDTVFKNNNSSFFSSRGGSADSVKLVDVFVLEQKQGLVEENAFLKADNVSIKYSVIDGEGKKAGFIIGSFNINASVIKNIGRLNFFNGSQVEFEKSQVHSRDSISIESQRSSIVDSKVIVSDKISFNQNGSDANIEHSDISTPRIYATYTNSMNIDDTIFKEKLNFYLGNSTTISDSKFDISSGALSFFQSGAQPTVARGNHFNPVVNFSSVINGADFAGNYWGDDRGLIRLQDAECRRNGVSCDRKLSTAPSIKAANFITPATRDVVPENYKKECESLTDETLAYLSLFLDRETLDSMVATSD